MPLRVLLTAVVLMLLAPASAGAVVFGANLNRPVNAAFDCRGYPVGGPAYFFQPTNANTCTWVGAGTTSFDLTETFGVPAAGVINAVRVKVGPATGPMQVTVLRSFRSTSGGTGFQCCFHAGETAVFTPAANAVTTVATALPVRNDLDPAFGETRDYIGLTVLAPGVPIPAHDTGNYATDGSAASALAFFPHVKAGDVRADGTGIGGIMPLLQANLVPCAGGGRRAVAAQCANNRIAAVTLGSPSLSRSGRFTGFSLVCNRTTTCRGTLRIQRGRTRRSRTYAVRTFSIGAGATRILTARLTAAGRALLRSRPTARVWVNIAVRSGKRTATSHVRARFLR